MDDDFLHRLRREPPADFALRLKSQLDRPPPPRRLTSRLILCLAIGGTAFALVLPPARRAVEDWFATNNRTQTEVPANSRAALPPLRSANESTEPSGTSRGATLPLRASASTSTAPQPPAPAIPAQSTGAPGLATPAPAPSTFSGVPQAPEQLAVSAVTLRQGLFKTLSFVMQPLNAMLQRGAPVDMGVVRTSATRLVTLSSIIPEVFSRDTRPLQLNTRALDNIWTNAPDFEARADELTLAADALSMAAASDDEVAALKAIRRIDAACTACHDVYRGQ